eukprot:COSAG03_NODE_1082_length_4861_cov_8.532129_3_plen_120_part_00
MAAAEPFHLTDPQAVLSLRTNVPGPNCTVTAPPPRPSAKGASLATAAAHDDSAAAGLVPAALSEPSTLTYRVVATAAVAARSSESSKDTPASTIAAIATARPTPRPTQSCPPRGPIRIV